MLYIPQLVNLPSQKVHSLVKGLYSKETGREIKPVSNELEETDTESGNFVNCRRIPNPILEGASTEQTSPFDKMNAKQIQLVNQEVRSMLEKGAIQKVFHSPRKHMGTRGQS